MPFPARTDAAAIVAAARTLIAAEGPEQLTLAKVAGALGIRAPSLYHHFASREVLLHAVIDQIIRELGATYVLAAASATEPATQLLAICRAHRAFAQANPRVYLLAFGTPAPEARPELTPRGVLLTTTGQIFAALVRPERILLAQRGMFALIHGFVMLELGGQFQLGDDLDATVDTLIRLYLVGLRAQ